VNKLITRLYKYYFIVVVGAFLSACTTDSSQPLKKNYANSFSSVVAKKSKFEPLASQVFSWRRDIILVDEESSVKVTPDMITYVGASIEQQLSLKNYSIQPASKKTDYYIAAAIILDESSDSKKITSFAKTYPGLSSSIYNNKKGNLIVMVFDKSVEATDKITERHILWTGSIQAFIAEEGMTLVQRKQRLNQFIASLMLKLPVGI
jgi:hypothetical protein